MQLLKPINVGHAPNDQTGDTLRDAMVVVNENFAKTRAGVDSVEVSAAAAQRKADAAVPAAEKGAAGGVTPLDAAGKVPAAHLPPPAVPLSQKSAPGGVAPLDDAGRVPVDHLPIPVPAVPLAEKGQPDGVATLAADGKITPVQLPDLIPPAEKARPNGVATLAADARIVPGQLPALIPAADKGRPGGVPTLDADGRVPAAQLPAAQDAVPLAEKGQAGGVATLDDAGKVPHEQLPSIPGVPPVGSVAWWSLRESIPPGQIPADGQSLSRAIFPDLARMVTSGKVPVVSDADWLADPLKRGSYTLGDGTSTIRVPDMNGKAAGSLGALYVRGDGARTSSINGAIANDTNRSHNHGLGVYGPTAGNSASFASGGGVAVATYFTALNGADESKPISVHGVWTIQGFSAVSNVGSVDVAQLASDHATLNAAFQALRGQIFGFGQALVDVGTSRAFGVTYTNTTGRPISIYIVGSATASAGGNMYLMVGGIMGTRVIATQNGITLALTAVIPPGINYRVVADSMTQNFWTEYR